jgi:predicted Zn-dependent protease
MVVMPDFLQGWLERWRVRREIDAIEYADKVISSAPFNAKLAEAKAAFAADDRVRTAELCASLRRLHPRLFEQSPDAINLLLGLRDFKEAERLAKRAMRAIPTESDFVRIYAQIAEFQGNLPAAIERWRFMTRKFPATPLGYIAGSKFLEQLGKTRDADRMLASGVRRCPEDAAIRIAFAELATRRNDWRQATARFRDAEGVAPCASQVGIAKCLIAMDQTDDAEALLAKAWQKFSHEPSPGIEYAWIAHRRGQWTEAAARWQKIRDMFPRQAIAYSAGGEALRELGEISAAKEVIENGISRGFQHHHILIEHARIATLSDLDEAAMRWAVFRDAFPNRAEGYREGALALLSAGRDEEAQMLLDQWQRRNGSN